ncbi:MAG: phenylacetate--CoA ligase family protein [Thermodesulfobacteriota bacterium]
MPPTEATARLAVMYQLEQSQWWTPEEIRAQQFRQISALLRHAFDTTTFYRERLKAAGFDGRSEITPEIFARIPLLRREDIQSSLEAMTSTAVPPGHGKVGEAKSSGSTGRPIRIYSTQAAHFFWKAFALRDHLWHRRDLSKKHADIRVGVESRNLPKWSMATSAVFPTGPDALLNIRESIDSQIEWIRSHQPYYLLTYPSNLREMARRCMEAGITLPGLGQVRTFGETVSDELRDLCRQAWGVELKDSYSSMEIGYMALQCPDHEHYHVMSEGVLLEVLDDAGNPCKPGEIGRVVITALHNFATPMIRYEILDYAQVGEPCPCGRGLPVLKRIMGRQRNMMRMPDGTTRWPSFGMRQWPCAGKIRHLQIVQKEIDRLLVRLVVKAPLAAADEQAVTGVIRDRSGYPFRVDFEYVDAIAKPQNFKFDLFVSEV